MSDESFQKFRNLPFIFCLDLSSGELAESEYRHFSKSQRVVDGTEVALFDGKGSFVFANFAEQCSIVSEIETYSQPKFSTVCFAPVKGVKPETIAKKLCELGISRIIPFFSERSVVRWSGEKANKITFKLEVSVREAAMQSKNLFIPEVSKPLTFENMLAEVDSLAMADPAGTLYRSSISSLCVGPEGGFSDSEKELVSDKVRLPGNVLRAETASVVAATLLTS